MRTRTKPTVVSTALSKGGRVSEALEDSDIRVPEIDASIRDTDRWALISEAAYYRAEKRGFEPGHELEDWLAAEADLVAGRIVHTDE